MSIFDDIFEGANDFLTGLSNTANTVLDAGVSAAGKLAQVSDIGKSVQTAPSDNGNGLFDNSQIINVALIFGGVAILMLLADNG